MALLREVFGHDRLQLVSGVVGTQGDAHFRILGQTGHAIAEPLEAGQPGGPAFGPGPQITSARRSMPSLSSATVRR